MTAAPTLPDIKIDPRASAEEARAFLERDRLMSAYALADVDQPEIEGTRWWVARRDGEIVAVALVVEGLPFRPCFAIGASDGLGAIFRDAIREPRVLLATPPRSRGAIELTYRFERIDHMRRMAVTIRRFRARVNQEVTRLGPEDLDAVIDLYGHNSRTYFTPQRLLREIYYGVYQGNALVAAAGTHVRSARSGIAAVGNVLTRLAYRGRGMARSCTSAVTETALEEHADVVLNVREDNAPAIAVYESLGYQTHGTFIEGPAARRPAWDRLLGSLKGGPNGAPESEKR
jgi:GNAT superfamily N-acetyltransferase